MADAYIQVAVDGVGKKMQTYENTIAGSSVHAEAITLVDSAGVPITALPVSISTQPGAANLTVTRSTASSTAGTLAIARATRRSILIRNLDTSLTIYVAPATVTTSNGFPILPGESCPFSWVGLIQVISVSGTPAYAVADEYA